MGMVHVLTEKGSGSRHFFWSLTWNHRNFYSPKILSAYGLSLVGHLPVSLFTSFWLFVSGIILWIGCTLV